MNPLWVEDDGQTIYFTMSLWNPYDVYLAKATFVALPDLGDYNGDGMVDAADYSVWRDTLGQRGTGLAADGNRNQIIDQGDYAIWKQHFAGGNVASSATSEFPSQVPESSTLAIVIAAALVAVSSWRAERPLKNRTRSWPRA